MEKLVYINTNMGVLYDSSHESSQRTEEDEVISDDEPCIVIENWGWKTKEREKTSLHPSNKTFKTLHKLSFKD